MNAVECFNTGDLEKAIAEAKATLKANPTDLGSRLVFCELLVFDGELARVDKQLETLAMQDPKSAMPTALFRQLVRAELAREECFKQGRAPELLDKPTDLMKKYIELFLTVRENGDDRAEQLLNDIEEARPKLSGKINGTEFSDFRDQDDRSSGFFEVLTSTGKYYWIPFDRVELVEFRKVERIRDQYWRQTHMTVKEGGPDGEVFVPVMYFGSSDLEDAGKLGRTTDWSDPEKPPACGKGMRMFWHDDEEIPIMEIERIEFN